MLLITINIEKEAGLAGENTLFRFEMEIYFVQIHVQSVGNVPKSAICYQTPETTVKPSESESNGVINLMRDSCSLAKIPYWKDIIFFNNSNIERKSC